MGQMTFAIMWAAEVPRYVDLHGDEDYDTALLPRWEKACAERIAKWDATHPRTSWSVPRGFDVYVPRTPYEGLNIVGFYVAAGASGKRGAAQLEGCAVADVKTHYAKAIKAAKRRWRRFAKWCAEQGVTLPKARLYFTETEVA